ncbi:MAG: ABC transporter permease [Candidatus Micrarchaeota archaeon]|nr:ABC transporter permease [Candidatus Micrarchaeota archaeon]
MSLAGDTFTLYKREMLIFRSNLRVNLVRSIMFPLVIILFFGNVGSSILNVPIAVVNYANNPQSLMLIGTLQSNNYLQISSITDQPTALNLLKNGKVQLVVIILPTFPSSQPGVPGVQVYYSNTQFSVTSFALPLISSAASKYTSNVQAGQPGGIQTQQNPAGEVSSNALYASKGSYKDFLVGGIVPMVVVFSALFGGGISLISDRQMGNLKAFFITPINKNAIVLSRILSGATQGILFAFLALGIGILDGAQLAGGWIALIYIVIVSVILSLGFIAIAVMIASKIKRVDAYAIFSQVVGLPLWFISGGILPTQSLPSWLASISVVDPLTYANTVIRAITLQGFIPINTLLVNLGVLGAFAIIMIYMSFRVFNSSNEE